MSVIPHIHELQPGDLLLYKPQSLFGWIIAVKTWNRISHCEVYAGGMCSVASRDGKGVGRYTFRRDGLSKVLRPNKPFDFDAAMRWFKTVDGQRYDWKGILVFTLAVKQGARDRQFCSEFATRFYRNGQFEPFSPSQDADTVAPATFLYGSGFYDVCEEVN